MLFALLALSLDAAADCEPFEVATRAHEARAELNSPDGEARAAVEAVRDAEENLGCVSQFVRDPADLSALFQTGGAAAAAIGEDAWARDWFVVAARLAGGVPLDRNLVPDFAWPLFEEAAAEVREGPQGVVRANVEIRLDGAMLSAGQTRAVPAGAHLAQHLGADGAVITTLIEVPADGEIAVGVAPTPPAVAESAGPNVALIAGGAVAVVGGGAALWQASYYREAAALYAYDEDTAKTAALYGSLCTAGGFLAVGLGTASLVGGALINQEAPGFVLSGRW